MKKALGQETTQIYAVVAVMATLFTYAAVMTIPAASVNQLADSFHVTNDTLSSVFRLFMAGFLCAAIAGGRISDSVGKMPVIAAGCALMAVGMFMFFNASSFAILPIAAVIAGIGGGLTEIVGTSLISDLYNGPKRTAMMNWSQVLFAAGAVAGPLVYSQILKMGVNWRQGYLVVTLLCVSTAAMAALAYRRPEKHVADDSEDRANLMSIVLNPKVIQLSVGLLLYVGSELGIVYWIARYLETDLKASHDMAAKSVAVLWMGLGFGRWIATRLSGRFSDTQLIRWSLLFAAIITSALLCVKSPMTGLALTFCAGVPLGPVWPTIVSRAGYLFPRQSGTVIGVVASVGCVGATLVPSVVGKLSDVVGIRAALWTSVIGLALALIVMMEKSGKPEKSL